MLAESCAACWGAWSEEQTRLIKHLGWQPFEPADKDAIYRHLHEFLKLQRGAAPGGRIGG